MPLVLLRVETRVSVEGLEGERSLYVILREKEGPRRYLVRFPFDAYFCFDASIEQNEGTPFLHGFFVETLKIVGAEPERVVIPTPPDEESELLCEITFRYQDGSRLYLPVTFIDALNIVLYVKCPIFIEDDYLTRSYKDMQEFIEDLLQENLDSRLGEEQEEQPVLSLEEAERRILDDTDDLPQA